MGRALAKSEQALLVLVIMLLAAGLVPARAEDEIDLMLRRGPLPPDSAHAHGYSDFTDPLGRFLDLLAAGAVADARAIQPAACASWRATRESSAFTDKVWIGSTQVSLDKLCDQR